MSQNIFHYFMFKDNDYPSAETTDIFQEFLMAKLISCVFGKTLSDSTGFLDKYISVFSQ